MVRYLTRSIYKRLVASRHRSEQAVLKARVKHAEAMLAWKKQHIFRIYASYKAEPGLKLFEAIQKKKQRKAYKEL